MELSKRAAPAFFRRSQLTWKAYQFQAFKNAMLMAIELDDKSKKSWNLYAFYLLGNMQFEQAEEAFKKGFGGDAYLELIKKWRISPITETNAAAFILDLQRLNLNREIALTMAQLQKGKTTQQKLAFLKRVIEGIHGENSGINFTSDTHDMSIKINGKNFRKCSLLNGIALKKIDLSETVITSIDLFTGWALEEINISKTKISDISPLKAKEITHLDISYTPINDISIVQSLPLKTVNLAGLRIKNLAPLLQCTTLEKVTLSQDLAERESYVVKELMDRCTVIILP